MSAPQPLSEMPPELLLSIGARLGACDLLSLRGAARAFGRGLACYGGRSVAEEAARLQCAPPIPIIRTAQALPAATEVALPAYHW